jgi:hypothetical protein
VTALRNLHPSSSSVNFDLGFTRQIKLSNLQFSISYVSGRLIKH